MSSLIATQTAPAGEGTSTEVDVNPIDSLTDSLDSMLEGFFEALPGIGIGLFVFVVFYVVAKLVRGPVERRLARAKTRSFGKVFASLVYAGILIAGLFFAIPLAVPSIELGGMLAGFGLLGVAAGFAFQDILSNMLAGILLLIRDPFRSGDQIEVNGIQGTVELITIRETQITTFDGRLVYVPNSEVYSNAIEVQTADPLVRSSLVVGVDYDADLGVAREAALRVLAGLEDVADDPAPQAYYTEFAASSINLDLRYWTRSRQADIRRVQDGVVEGIKNAFDEQGIGIPFSIVTLDADDSFERAMVRALGGTSSPAAASGNGASGNGHAGNGQARTKRPDTPVEQLDEMTREELYEMAQKRGVEGRSQMNKAELVEALRDSER